MQRIRILKTSVQQAEISELPVVISAPSERQENCIYNVWHLQSKDELERSKIVLTITPRPQENSNVMPIIFTVFVCQRNTTWGWCIVNIPLLKGKPILRLSVSTCSTWGINILCTQAQVSTAVSPSLWESQVWRGYTRTRDIYVISAINGVFRYTLYRRNHCGSIDPQVRSTFLQIGRFATRQGLDTRLCAEIENNSLEAFFWWETFLRGLYSAAMFCFKQLHFTCFVFFFSPWPEAIHLTAHTFFHIKRENKKSTSERDVMVVIKGRVSTTLSHQDKP